MRSYTTREGRLCDAGHCIPEIHRQKRGWVDSSGIRHSKLPARSPPRSISPCIDPKYQTAEPTDKAEEGARARVWVCQETFLPCEHEVRAPIPPIPVSHSFHQFPLQGGLAANQAIPRGTLIITLQQGNIDPRRAWFCGPFLDENPGASIVLFFFADVGVAGRCRSRKTGPRRCAVCPCLTSCQVRNRLLPRDAIPCFSGTWFACSGLDRAELTTERPRCRFPRVESAPLNLRRPLSRIAAGCHSQVRAGRENRLTKAQLTILESKVQPQTNPNLSPTSISASPPTGLRNSSHSFSRSFRLGHRPAST